MTTLQSPKQQLENSYNHSDSGVTIKRVRLRRLTVKDDTLLDVLYEESDDNGHTWFDGSKKVETFGIESVFDEVKTLKSILTRGYDVEGVWDDSDLEVTKIDIKYQKKKEADDDISPGAVLEVAVSGKIKTQQCKEKSLPLALTMKYSKDGESERGYIQPDEAKAIAAISQIIQTKVIEILSAPPKFKSVQLSLEMS